MDFENDKKIKKIKSTSKDSLFEAMGIVISAVSIAMGKLENSTVR